MLVEVHFLQEHFRMGGVACLTLELSHCLWHLKTSTLGSPQHPPFPVLSCATSLLADFPWKPVLCV